MKNLLKCSLAILLAASLFTLFSCSHEPEKEVERPTVEGKIGVYEAPYFVGDIVFNDGSAASYKTELSEEQEKAAIAVIFYVGTKLNNDNEDGTPDKETVRTLGVGLEMNTSYEICWCLESSSGNKYSIDSLICKDEYNNKTSSYDFTGNKNGKDSFAKISSFYKENGIEDDTQDISNYPVFEYAENYSTIAKNLEFYSDGWYIPSLAELYEFSKVFQKISENSTVLNDSEFEFRDSFFTSSQFSKHIDTVAGIVLRRKYIFEPSKKDNYSVCVIREF